MADRALHHDVDALHRDAAAGGGVAVDAEQPATAGGAGRLAGVALDMDEARHHVLGDAGAGAAMDDDGRLLVHAGAVVADRAVDLDGDRRVEAGGDGMTCRRDCRTTPVALVGVGPELVEGCVQFAERRDPPGRCPRSKHSAVSTSVTGGAPRNRRSTARAPRPWPFSMPGRTASARYSEPNAT